MILYKNGTRQITKNFSEKELFSDSFNAPESHTLSDATINGLQIIRDYYNVPITVVSTYRTPEHNTKIGGAKDSQHVKKTAIDGDFNNDELTQKFHAEILNKGELYHRLRKAGVNGFGLYDNFFHIDSRQDNMSERDEYGQLEIWDNRKKKTLT